MINDALREYLSTDSGSFEDILRKVIREEMGRIT